MTYLEAIIIAIVEGITEFLPISSTGHMIITQAVLGIPYTDFVKAFTVNIQFGAILSVIILYWKHFFQSVHFYYKLFVAFIPAAIIGFLLGDYIDAMLENVVVVAVSLVIGGIILLFVDNWFKNADDTQKEVSYKQALKIGFFQCIAMIPDVSRSAATIIGGLSQKLNRKYAAEFSFFLAVPTMFAASAYKLLKTYEVIDATNIKILIVGNITAFVVALIAIRTFITYLQKHGFKLFGYYRIILGLVILLLLLFGIPLNLGL